jgi:hypothetical protein
MMATDEVFLNAQEVQSAIAFVLRKASSLKDAEQGAISAALVVTVSRRGPVGAVDCLRDLADLIERDVVIPPGEVLQ